MITNNLLVLNYDESLSIEAKLKYLQNTFNSIQPEILAAIDKARTLIPTIDSKVSNLFQQWVASGEFNNVILTELQPQVAGFPPQITDQQNSTMGLQNNNQNNQDDYNTQLANQQANQLPISQIQTIVSSVTNTINTVTTDYGLLYNSYLNIQNIYNQVTADTTTHGNNVDAISSQITTLYGNVTALLNLVNSFNHGTDFYTNFDNNFKEVLNEFSTSVTQNATDITNLTQLLNDYQTPIANATNELTTITNTYNTEIAQWQAFLSLMDQVDGSITNAQNLLLTLNAKITRDTANINNNATIISQLPQPESPTFTPQWFDVTAQSIFQTAATIGSASSVGFWQVGVNKFIFILQATITATGQGINQGNIICPLPTPLQDANFLPTFTPQLIPVRAANPTLNPFFVEITPWGIRAHTNVVTDGVNPIFLSEVQFFMVGTG